MADVKRYAIAGGTFACIAAIGFFMQGNDQPAPKVDAMAAGVTPAAPAQPTGQISNIALTSAESGPRAETPDLAEMTNASLTLPAPTPAVEIPDDFAPIASPQPDAAPLQASLARGEDTASDAAAEARKPLEAEAQCDITMTAKPMAAALVKLDLEAPCLPNERLTMHHGGMVFTDTTDADGKYQMAVPALAETAVFIASFANGDGTVASANVPELGIFDRAVVQSSFKSGAALHALEFGADYDSDGHVWANASGEIADAAVGKGGFMMLMGNPAVSDALTAQVYTFPTGFSERGGEIELSVEVEVTDANCGQDIEAQTLQVVPGDKPKVQALDLAMPGCDAVGDFLVLKNLVNDLKVASATN